MRRTLLIFAFALVASPVWAQPVKIAFHDGLVSVDCSAALPRAILAEWGKAGGTTIVNGDRVPGTPLTLKLVDVPEAQALEIILRNVAGYMAAPRRAQGGSRYDRILVLPTSTVAAAPAAPAAVTPRPTPFGPQFGPNNMGTQRFIPPRPMPPQGAVEEPPEPDDPPEVNQPVFTFPQPAGAQPFQSQPYQGQPNQMPASMPMPEAPSTTPAFGVVGAPMPGMIQMPQQPPPQPGRPTRPPGH